MLPVSFLVVLSFLYINIYINTTLANSHAVNDTDSYSFNLADTTNLSISLPAPETLTLTPSAEGVFGSKSIAVGVSTNSPYGYTLTMSAASSSLSRSAAVGGVTPTIPALETAVSEADFPNNYWGFKRTSTAVTDTNYQPMLANHSVLVNNTSANADSSSSTITFGVKLSNETPSGDYSINIDFLAVTNVAPNLYYMQDATPSSLAAAMPSVGDTTVLYDRRDNKEYTIAKLADGKYWMTKNLAFIGTIFTTEDSNVLENTTMDYYDYGSTECTPPYAYNNACIRRSDDYGVWYNYSAATAMSISGEDNQGISVHDICPKGWNLPAKDDFSEIVDYVDQYAPTSGGYQDMSGVTQAEKIGYWFSATPSSKTSTYGLLYNSDTNQMAIYDYASRAAGVYVRCLFDDTMQSFSSDYASALAINESLQLRDVRDGKEYWVTKLADGNVWMTQNLDFDITGDTLSSTTTNLVTYGSEPYTSDKGYSQDSITGEITWTPISTGTTIITGRDKTGANGEINYGVNAGKWANSSNNPYSVDPGEWYQSGTYFASSVCNNVTGSTGCNFLNSAKNTAQDGVTALTTYFRQTSYENNGTHGAIGNWYNWSAAVAANDTSAITSGTLTNSVCPAGWELPANGKYNALNTIYNSSAASGALDAGLFSAPLYFVRGGDIYTGGATTLYDAGRGGVYWSGTTYSADGSYYLSFRSSGVGPDDGRHRGDGGSVRCLLRTE